MSSKNFFENIGTAQNINEFIQKLPLAVAFINNEREIVSYNRAFFLMAGREIRQGTHNCYEFTNFSFCQTDCLAHMSTKSKRTINWDESRGVRKNGDELIVRPTVIPVFKDEKEISGHILIFQNTTDEVHLYRNFRANLEHLERKVAFLQALNEVADRFRKITQIDTLMESISEFVVKNLSIDCCQIIQKDENDNYAAKKSTYAETCSQFEDSTTALVKSIEDHLQDFQEDTEPYRHLTSFENSDNSAGQKETVILPIRSGSSYYGHLVSHRIISENTIPEEQIEYLLLFAKSVGPYIENAHIITNLEKIVAERTSELQSAQAQLMESTRLASVGEMAGMVAHEVLNPMTAVLARIRKIQEEDGNLTFPKLIVEDWQKDMNEGGSKQLIETLQEVPEDADAPLIEEDVQNISECLIDLHKDVRFIEEQLNRIVSIVDNLRGLSRAQNRTQSTDVKDVVNKTSELVKDGLKKRLIQLVKDFEHKSNVFCDVNELIQVIHNLIRNAMQAIDRNGTITITTSETPERVEIRVQDTGTGIPENIAPKIFEMRFTTKKEKEGTGLGLNLSRRLMRQVMGDVELESLGGNGSGAVFLVWIPKGKPEG